MKKTITQSVWLLMAAMCLLGFLHTGSAYLMPCVFVCVATSHILFFIEKGEK